MRLRKSKPLCKIVRSCLYRCEQCGTTERIPEDMLAFFDVIDPDEPECPTTFACQLCPGIMYPDWFLRAKRDTP